MDFPQGFYQMQSVIAQHLGQQLRPAQQRGLTLWVMGTVLAHSACQNAVLSALVTMAALSAKLGVLREYLREWLYDGEHKAAPCRTQVDVSLCFAPLLSWLVSLWQDSSIALAIDACSHQDRVTALVVSVLYQGCAIPLAWHILPGNKKAEWIAPILELLDRLAPSMPQKWDVLVMADRGLWSRRLFSGIQKHHWHPVMRVQNNIYFRPLGQGCLRVASLVQEPGCAWVGEGHAFNGVHGGLSATLMVFWAQGQKEAWVVLSDIPADKVGVCWYRLRMWIELGFRALKGFGWRWNKTYRQDPKRVARHFLVMAVATLWVLACGTRVDEAMGVEKPAYRLRRPQRVTCTGKSTLQHTRCCKHTLSLFRLGLEALCQQIIRGRLWNCLWLQPDPWPVPPPSILITYHSPP